MVVVRSPSAVLYTQVTEIDLDYTDCETLSAQTSTSSLSFTDMPSSKYTYKLRASDSGAPVSTPQWAFVNRTGTSGVAVGEEQQCVLQFDVPAEVAAPVMLYYKLTNFYQNHRRYVKSLNQNQLRGDSVSESSLSSGDCKPLGVIDGKIVYPCGLIANSVFNGACSIHSRLPERCPNPTPPLPSLRAPSPQTPSRT